MRSRFVFMLSRGTFDVIIATLRACKNNPRARQEKYRELRRATAGMKWMVIDIIKEARHG